MGSSFRNSWVIWAQTAEQALFLVVTALGSLLRPPLRVLTWAQGKKNGMLSRSDSLPGKCAKLERRLPKCFATSSGKHPSGSDRFIALGFSRTGKVVVRDAREVVGSRSGSSAQGTPTAVKRKSTYGTPIVGQIHENAAKIAA